MKNLLLPELLEALWKEYSTTNPPAKKIHDIFLGAGETVVNDHIAFRTFNHPSISLDKLAGVFTNLGYVPKGQYRFAEKRLFARHYEHPDTQYPLIFISQLLTEEFEPEIRQIINGLVAQIPEDFTSDPSFIYAGRPWNATYQDYNKLKAVSEYAAWMAAYGFRANHFTISVNHLRRMHEMNQVNRFLKEAGFVLNTSGGEIKGSPEVYLEQSSTLAYNREVEFTDGTHVIPACYYEFARRYPMPDGTLFRGFVEGSADKIFESTNAGQGSPM